MTTEDDIKRLEERLVWNFNRLERRVDAMERGEVAEVGNLLPCPFCGGRAKVQWDSDCYYRVECSNSACRVAPITFRFLKRQEALDTWNWRVWSVGKERA